MAPVESRTETFDEAAHRRAEVKQFFTAGNQPVIMAQKIIAEACSHGADPLMEVYQIAAIEGSCTQDEETNAMAITQGMAREMFRAKGLFNEVLAAELLDELGDRPFSYFGARINNETLLLVLERPEKPTTLEEDASALYYLKVVHCV